MGITCLRCGTSITRSLVQLQRPGLTKGRSSGWADKPTKHHRRSQLSLWAQGPCKARSCPPVFYDRLPRTKPRGDCGTPGPRAGPYLGVLCTHQRRSGEARAHRAHKLLSLEESTRLCAWTREVTAITSHLVAQMMSFLGPWHLHLGAASAPPSNPTWENLRGVVSKSAYYCPLLLPGVTAATRPGVHCSPWSPLPGAQLPRL